MRISHMCAVNTRSRQESVWRFTRGACRVRMPPSPGFSFSGRWTGNKGWPGQPQSQGNAFADFLLGVADSSSTSAPGHDVKFSDKTYESYVQDTWQASRRLTIYYGIRYQYQAPWEIRDNLRSSYNFQTNKLILPQDSMFQHCRLLGRPRPHSTLSSLISLPQKRSIFL